MTRRIFTIAGALFGLIGGYVSGVAQDALALLIITGMVAVAGFTVYPVPTRRPKLTEIEDDNG
jgi:hypothetical protein